MTTTITNEDLNNCLLQVVPMTFEEKVRMYMRCTKLELARMLAERDRTGIDLQPIPYTPMPQPQPIPYTPMPQTQPYPFPNPWDGPIYTNKDPDVEVNY